MAEEVRLSVETPEDMARLRRLLEERANTSEMLASRESPDAKFAHQADADFLRTVAGQLPEAKE